MPSSVVRRVPHPWEELYSLVLEVGSYPRFVPFCHALDVLEQVKRNGADKVTARMEVGFAAFRERFTSRILGRRASQEILISNVDGPFRYFEGRWLFTPGDDRATDIRLEVDYQFCNPFMPAVVSTAFWPIAEALVAAFETRAAQVLA
jgi:coenzyme Q-binding protein COQ10